MIWTTFLDPSWNTIKQICTVNSKDLFLPQGVNQAVETQGQFTMYALSGDRLHTHPKQWSPSRSPEEAKTGSMLDKSLYFFSTQFHSHITDSNMALHRGTKTDLLSRFFWIEVFAEFLTTLLYLFLACGTGLRWNNTPNSVMHIALTSGLSIATLAMSVFHVSGGLINPALTICLMAVGRVSVLKAVFFIVAESAGGKDAVQFIIIRL